MNDRILHVLVCADSNAASKGGVQKERFSFIEGNHNKIHQQKINAKRQYWNGPYNKTGGTGGWTVAAGKAACLSYN